MLISGISSVKPELIFADMPFRPAINMIFTDRTFSHYKICPLVTIAFNACINR